MIKEDEMEISLEGGGGRLAGHVALRKNFVSIILIKSATKKDLPILGFRKRKISFFSRTAGPLFLKLQGAIGPLSDSKNQLFSLHLGLKNADKHMIITS